MKQKQSFPSLLQPSRSSRRDSISPYLSALGAGPSRFAVSPRETRRIPEEHSLKLLGFGYGTENGVVDSRSAHK